MINFYRNSCVITIVLFLIITVAGSALAGNVASRADRVNIQLYGQINRALLFANDGEEGYLFHVDNDLSGTLIGIKANVKSSDALTIGAKLEVEIQSNASNNVNQNNPNEGTDFPIRQEKS